VGRIEDRFSLRRWRGTAKGFKKNLTRKKKGNRERGMEGENSPMRRGERREKESEEHKNYLVQGRTGSGVFSLHVINCL
jgi:hypothetical protein